MKEEIKPSHRPADNHTKQTPPPRVHAAKALADGCKAGFAGGHRMCLLPQARAMP